MAPLPPSNTARYKVFYEVISQKHTFELRVNPAFSPSDMGTFIDAMFDALDSSLYLGSVTEVQFAAEGSDIFNPVVTGQEGRTFGSAGGSSNEVPKFLNWVGRSAGGRRVRLAVFGYQGGPSTWRVTTGEDAHVATVQALLNGTENAGLAIDGLKAIWKPYANFGYNAHWQRAVRA